MRGISAQQLAGRCAELGMTSLNRAVLAKLENGRREAVSTAELLVLARALEVAPMLILFPLGQDAATDVAPAHSMPTWEAVRWFYGLGRECMPAGEDYMTSDDPVALFETHDFYVGRYHDLAVLAGTQIHGFSFAQELAAMVGEIRHQRERIRNAGLVPPSLPPDLSRVDDETWPPSLDVLLAETQMLNTV